MADRPVGEDWPPDPASFGPPMASAFTPEGRKERLTLFLAGTKRARGWRKWLAYALLLIPLWLILVALVVGAANAVFGR
jgi:hypothetical protein